tara:strand:+ start:6279 stop:6617 length:339 start_codon:yes stop_codon:yes gene_type:complete
MMKKILIISFCLLFLGNKPTFKQEEKLVALNDILVYCNTKEFIKKMATNDYMLGLAADGVVNDDRHQKLLSMELLINQNNKQWAIIFNYAKNDFSCIMGGNHIKLFAPKKSL